MLFYFPWRKPNCSMFYIVSSVKNKNVNSLASGNTSDAIVSYQLLLELNLMVENYQYCKEVR